MSVNQDSPKTSPDARQPNGQFARGNAGGPGNPYARHAAAFRDLLLRCVTADDFVAVAAAVVEKAKAGDVPAARLLFQYTLGKPLSNPHPDRLDADELEAFKRNAAPKNVQDHISSVPLEPALELMRVTVPYWGDDFRRQFKATFAPRDGEAARGQAADNKRIDGRQPKPKSADATVAFAEAETLRLVNEPERRGQRRAVVGQASCLSISAHPDRLAACPTTGAASRRPARRLPAPNPARGLRRRSRSVR